MKNNKKIFYTLMNLESKKADEYLAKFANGIESKISKSKNNDEIFENLELLEEFIYKVSDQALRIANNVIKDKESNKVTIHKTKFGEHDGKTHADLVLKCLELLDKIRYIKISEVFNLLVKLYSSQNLDVKKKAEEVLNSLISYDPYTLQEISYLPQRTVLNIIKELGDEEKTKNVEIIKLAISSFLKPSCGGHSMKDYKTLVVTSGALNPDKNLIKLRKESIKLITTLYGSVRGKNKVKTKIDLLKSLENASRYPSQGDYSKIKGEMDSMIVSDIKNLTEFYREIIFNEKQEIVAEMPVVQEIESQLIWFNRKKKNIISEAASLLKEIRNDDFYHLYRLLVGDVYVSSEEKRDLETVKKERDKEIDLEFKKIGEENINKWIEKLNLIARDQEIKEDWDFIEFRRFLGRIASEKTELAQKILDDAFNSSKHLKKSILYFLFGFRECNNTEIYDDYVKKIIKERDIDLLINVPASLAYIDPKHVRKEDVDLLNGIIIERREDFKFLKKVDSNKLNLLHYNVMRALLQLYKKNELRVRRMIKSLMNINDNYIPWVVKELDFAEYRKKIDLLKWSKLDLVSVLDKIVELENLDYNAQRLLLIIAREHFREVMNVFIERIKKVSELKIKGDGWFKYDAIPPHFNDDLKKYIKRNREYPKLVGSWIKSMTSDQTAYNWELNNLLQAIGGVDDILLKMVKEGDEDNLNKVIDLSEGVHPPGFDFCFEIIKKTDDKKIWKRVGAAMYRTGMVSGEHGISEAYKSKLNEIKPNEKDHRRVREFKQEMIKDLKTSIKKARQREDEEIKLMKMDYEG
ncbi:MAG: hypothetical protein HQ530_00460 [Parcubacteria group bacterium]|nr:hypothetical protein [Parcubacteria group bacterium]